MKIKGRTIIELFDKDTNEKVSEVTSDNYITNYIKDIFARHPLSGNSSTLAQMFRYSGYNPKNFGTILEKIFGGMLLFNKQCQNDPDNKDDYFLYADNMIAGAGVSYPNYTFSGNVSSLTSPKDWNQIDIAAESNTISLQWDFNADQCNDMDINAVALCPNALALTMGPALPYYQQTNTITNNNSFADRYLSVGYVTNAVDGADASGGRQYSNLLQQEGSGATNTTTILDVNYDANVMDLLILNSSRDNMDVLNKDSFASRQSCCKLLTDYTISLYRVPLIANIVNLLHPTLNFTDFTSNEIILEIDDVGKNYLQNLSYKPSIMTSYNHYSTHGYYILVCGGHSQHYYSGENEELLLLNIRYDENHNPTITSTILTNKLKSICNKELYIGNQRDRVLNWSQYPNSTFIVTDDYITFIGKAYPTQSWSAVARLNGKQVTDPMTATECGVFWLRYDMSNNILSNTTVQQYTYVNKQELYFKRNNANEDYADYVWGIFRYPNGPYHQTNYVNGVTNFITSVLPDSADVVSVMYPVDNNFSEFQRLYHDNRPVIQVTLNPITSEIYFSNNYSTLIPVLNYHTSNYCIPGSRIGIDRDGIPSWDHMCLSTINNLDTPISKTSSQTMRITYKLIFEEE